MTSPRMHARLALVWIAIVGATGCHGASDRVSDRYDRQQLRASLAEDDRSEAGLVLGVYPLKGEAVVDGDTIRVAGLDTSLRLLAIDTEETFKKEEELQAFQQLGFAGYLAQLQGESERPVKCATPLGMEAKKFAQEFFKGVTNVRLERDHPKEIRGHYNRYLTYVFAEKNGQWVNYNVESVRAGMSPYFTKYGYSRRFHEEFVQAQAQARAAGRGIWDPNKDHYRDYPVRLAWWNARAEFLAAFEHAEGPGHIVLTRWDAMDTLRKAVGQDVVLLGAVGRIIPGRGRAPAKVLLSRDQYESVPLVFFDEDVLARSGIARAEGEHVTVRGTVSAYERSGRKPELQIVVDDPEQISINEAPHRILLAARNGEAPAKSAPEAEAPGPQP